jgi:hypothetical protein
MKFTQILLVVIVGAALNYGIVSGLFVNSCSEKLTAEEYFDFGEVCTECYNEWQTPDIYYNCP